MKKLFVVLACIGALAIAGCGDKETPEAFGKKYIEKKFENINCELDDLDYSITDETDDTATVLVEGKITYKEEIKLVKKDDKWMIGEKNDNPEDKADVTEATHEEVKAEVKAAAHEEPAKKVEEHAAPAAHDPNAHH